MATLTWYANAAARGVPFADQLLAMETLPKEMNAEAFPMLLYGDQFTRHWKPLQLPGGEFVWLNLPVRVRSQMTVGNMMDHIRHDTGFNADRGLPIRRIVPITYFYGNDDKPRVRILDLDEKLPRLIRLGSLKIRESPRYLSPRTKRDPARYSPRRGKHMQRHLSKLSGSSSRSSSPRRTRRRSRSRSRSS